MTPVVLLIVVLLGLHQWRLRQLGREIDALQAQDRRCRHEDVKNEGTFGAPSYVCQTCGAVVE